MTNSPGEYVRLALQSLGADQRLVRGAELALRTFDLASKDGFDLQIHLKSNGTTFVRFLESIAAQLDIKVIRTRGTDILVGFSTAEVAPPTSEKPIQFRHDVFLAFSRFEGGFAYNSISDEFGKGLGLDTVPVAALAIEDAKAIRRDFARALGGSDETALVAALNDETHPLQTYAIIVRERRLLERWQAHFSFVIKQRVLDWAAQHNITVRPIWFERSKKYPSLEPVARRHVLREFIDEMSDEDLAQIVVPLSLVEKLWAHRAH